MKFLDLHAGPEYCFFYKCANTNLVAFICLIFGGSLPLLYLIGMVAILNQYIMERLSLTYLYKLPPIYNDKMTKSSTNIISFAPLIALSILLWQFTNK